MAEINRLVWEKGDFGAVAPMGWDVGEVVLGHVCYSHLGFGLRGRPSSEAGRA